MNDSEKILQTVTRLDQSLTGRGGVLDRLDRMEATLEEHRGFVSKIMGIVVGVSAFFSFMGSKLGTLLFENKHVGP